MNIAVDVVNYLKLLRNSTFKDRLSFVDESIQNAERAGAKMIHFRFEDNYISFYNDGEVLEDPSALLTIAQSGWNDEVMEQESPFGLGFFANIVVADNILVRSGKHVIAIPVAKMLRTGSPVVDVNVAGLELNNPGFYVRLDDLSLTNSEKQAAARRALQIGAFANIDVYVDQELAEKEDFCKSMDEDFERIVREDGYEGCVYPSDYYWNSEVLIYLRGREITKLALPYISGRIQVADSTLNLTAPDRKGIIQDEKYNTFCRHLKRLAKEMAKDLLRAGKEHNAIEHYLADDPILEEVPLECFAEDSVDFLFNPTEAAISVEDIEAHAIQDSVEAYTPPEVHTDMETTHDFIEPAKTGGGGGGYYSGGGVLLPLPRKMELNAKAYFYVENDKQYTYQDQINQAVKAGATIILVKSKLAELAVKYYKRKGAIQIAHISEVDTRVTVYAEVSSITSEIHDRAYSILKMLSGWFEKGEVRIGAITPRAQLLSNEGKVLHETLLTGEGYHDKQRGIAYIDNSSVQYDHLQPGNSKVLRLCDIKFVIANMPMLVPAFSKAADCDESDVYQKLLGALLSSRI